MLYALFCLLALIATLIGSLIGIGGGIIMKPLLDLSGHFDAANIGLISAATVFAMAVMSFLCQRNMQTNTHKRNLFLLGASSVAGGILGHLVFKAIERAFNSDALLKIIQNIILIIIVLFIILYMVNQSRIRNLSLKHWAFYMLTGLFLGCISSFLGIGGGPLNVAILMFLFSMDIKTATFYSIVTILFAQLSNLASIFISEMISGEWFASYELLILPFMVAAGLIGASIGSRIKKKVNNGTLIWCFNAMQMVIIAICIFNLIKYIKFL